MLTKECFTALMQDDRDWYIYEALADLTDDGTVDLQDLIDALALIDTNAIVVALQAIEADIEAGNIILGNLETKVTGSNFLSVQTSATGATWVALGSQACNEVELLNDTGTDIELRYGTGANVFVLKSAMDPTATYVALSTAQTFWVSANASELQVRRVDQDNAQVTMHGIWRARA